MNMRSRLWTFIFYPESMPEDWKTILTVSGYQYAISPLHEFDTDKNGELKKAHYHAVLYNDNQVSFKSVERITKRLNAPIPQVARSSDGILDYLNHKNAEDKYQYALSDIQYINDFDRDNIPHDITEERDLLGCCLEWIDFLNISEFADFIDCIKDDRELLEYAVKKTTFFNNVIKSRRYCRKSYVEFVQHDDFIEII